MYGLVQAIRDGDYQELLCFETKEEAERFKKFVNTYMEESGAGNGYGAYWVYTNAQILGCDMMPDYAKTQLDTELLESMLASILVARTASKPFACPPVSLITFGGQGKPITFEYGELPPRQRPKVGDMYRGLFPIRNSDVEEVAHAREGRVVADHGATLEVISSWDEGDNGKPKPDAKRVCIPADQVMKINDWLREIRGYPETK